MTTKNAVTGQFCCPELAKSFIGVMLSSNKSYKEHRWQMDISNTDWKYRDILGVAKKKEFLCIEMLETQSRVAKYGVHIQIQNSKSQNINWFLSWFNGGQNNLA